MTRFRIEASNLETDIVMLDSSRTPLETAISDAASVVAGDIAADAVTTSKILDANVTLAKMADLAQDQFIGRTSASTGVPQTATITAAARTILDDASTTAILTTLGVQNSIQDPGTKATNNLRVASDVVSAETVTIGADVYEVDIVNTDSTDDTAGGTFANTTNPITIVAATYPNVPTAVGRLIRVENEIMRVTATGTSLTLARGESGTTIASHADATDIYISNGIAGGSTIAVGLVTTLTPTAFTAALVDDINTRGTEAIVATLISVNEVLLTASAVGAVTTATTEGLGGANNGFRAVTMTGGQAAGLHKYTIQQRVPTAVEVALDHMHFAFDFTPTIVQVLVVLTATPGIALAWDGAITISTNLVKIDNSGIADWAATNTVTVIAAT